MLRIAFLLAALAPACLLAQVQEQSMQERLLNPDRSKTSEFVGRAFEGGSNLKLEAFRTTNYGGSKGFGIASYVTQPFLGIGKWFSKEHFPVERANVAQAYPTAAANLADRTLPIAASHLTEKEASTRPGIVPVKTTDVPAKAQGALDDISRQLKGAMTMDEVRDLLNKGNIRPVSGESGR